MIPLRASRASAGFIVCGAGVTALACLAAAACAKPDTPPVQHTSAAVAAPVADAAGCPATGLWADCSVMNRLERAGLAPHVDSGASPSDKELVGRPLLIKIGLTAELELFLYTDSTARIADAKKLDRSQLVGATAMQTMRRERTLIESANLLGLLTSINSHQRERVSDALTAGPPQPPAQ
jgi:hypothetical protein